MTEYLTRIQQSKKQIISLIQEYIKSQKEVWQELPYLAFLADGLGGWNQYYQFCYTNKAWLINSPYGFKDITVSCLTGLVTTNNEVLLLNCSIQELNATTHKNHLIKELKLGRRSYSQRSENWIETNYKEFKLDKDKIIWYKLKYC